MSFIFKFANNCSRLTQKGTFKTTCIYSILCMYMKQTVCMCISVCLYMWAYICIHRVSVNLFICTCDLHDDTCNC